MAKEEPKDELKIEMPPTSDEDAQIAFAGPAYFTNRFYVTLSNGGVRIAFAEQGGIEGVYHFRTAAAMSYQDAILLYKLLQKLLKDVESSLEEMIAKEREEQANG